jgi:hypothetical protein
MEARANGHRLMPITMRSSHTRVSRSTAASSPASSRARAVAAPAAAASAQGLALVPCQLSNFSTVEVW